jgi:hypothetical protein
MAKTLQEMLAKISLRKLEEASVVFKETQEGSEYYEVLKTRDPMLTLGGQYSEDLVKYYVLVNEKVIVLGAGEDLSEEEQPLKVGDYAKVVDSGTSSIAIEGEIVEVLATPYKDWDYNAKFVTKRKKCRVSTEQFMAGELVRATDEEVSEAKRKHAEQVESERWAKIGRKPLEYKVGDAVRYKNAFTTVTTSKRGLIRIDQSNHETRNIEVRPTDLTLVFPVEARFDGADRP